jgi:hypothetical protein
LASERKRSPVAALAESHGGAPTDRISLALTAYEPIGAEDRLAKLAAAIDRNGSTAGYDLPFQANLSKSFARSEVVVLGRAA